MAAADSTSPSSKKTADSTVVEMRILMPSYIEGLYFVVRADGRAVSDATARIGRDERGDLYMQIYSDQPTRRFSITWDETRGMLHSDILGDGLVSYDRKLHSVEINFSDIWVLIN